MSAIRYFHLTEEEKIIELKSLDEALTAMHSKGFIWIDIEDPSQELFDPLVKPFELHPLSIEDCIDEGQVPKIDDLPGYTFVVFNNYNYHDRNLSVEEINFFISKKYLITVHKHNAADKDFFDKILSYAKRSTTGINKGPDYLFYVIMDYIVDHKFETLEKIQDKIDKAETDIINEPGAFSPQSLIEIRGQLLDLYKSLFHEREILSKLCRRDSPYISEKTLYYYRDIYDHLTRFFEFIEINRELITNLMELYLSLINVKMATISNETNKVVRRLTLITTIFMPLTLLASIGGMSEWSMMTGAQNWRITYPLFMLAMVAIGTLSYLILKWSHWIDVKEDDLKPPAK